MTQWGQRAESQLSITLIKNLSHSFMKGYYTFPLSVVKISNLYLLYGGKQTFYMLHICCFSIFGHAKNPSGSGVKHQLRAEDRHLDESGQRPRAQFLATGRKEAH